MSIDKAVVWKYSEEFHSEDELLLWARGHEQELGIASISAGAGALIRTTILATHAKTAIEIGSGAGISGLWILSALQPDGVLTSIEKTPAVQQAAKRTFAHASFTTGRVRAILGDGLEVLPRLSDRAYDVVFLNLQHLEPQELSAHLQQVRRVLKPGGLLLVQDALGSGEMLEPADRSEEATAFRSLHKQLKDNDEWISSFVGIGNGLLLSVKKEPR